MTKPGKVSGQSQAAPITEEAVAPRKEEQLSRGELKEWLGQYLERLFEGKVWDARHAKDAVPDVYESDATPKRTLIMSLTPQEFDVIRLKLYDNGIHEDAKDFLEYVVGNPVEFDEENARYEIFGKPELPKTKLDPAQGNGGAGVFNSAKRFGPYSTERERAESLSVKKNKLDQPEEKKGEETQKKELKSEEKG